MTTKAEYKIIADHLRSSSFLIADGILPSNEGRGYVLRRIMRRAMLQLYKLGTQDPTMYKFVDALIKEMGQAYPELKNAKDLIIETLKIEEENFRKALKNGLKIIDEEIAKMESEKNYVFDAKIAFKLHDTYGFPLDLTQIILDEKFPDKKATIDQKIFDEEMEKQKEMARASWKGGGEEALDSDILKLQSQFGETYFSGYEEELYGKHGSKILYISNNGSEVQEISQNDKLNNCFIILDQTPFYATSGGQKGDSGQIKTADLSSLAEIKEAKKIGKLFIHHVEKIEGKFTVNQNVIAWIDVNKRLLKTYNHSATHLMHKALKIILGNSITQKGSNVDSDYFTFDFNLNRAMTNEEITKVEDLVNFYIKQGSESKTEEMDLEKAMESGAAALFGEKYDKKVRVVSLGKDENNSPYSIELCGGTHVKNTKEIVFFKIISEKSIASGVRRIEGRTNSNAKKYIIEQFNNLKEELDKIVSNINIQIIPEIFQLNPKEKIQKISPIEFDQDLTNDTKFDAQKISKEIKFIEEEIKKNSIIVKTLTKTLNQLKQNQLLNQLDNIKIEKIGEINFLTHIFDDIPAKDLTQIANNLKSQHQNATITLLFAKNDDKVSALIQISQDLLAKYDASSLIKTIVNNIGAKGAGGKKDFAMTGGDNKNGIKEAIETIKNQIK